MYARIIAQSRDLLPVNSSDEVKKTEMQKTTMAKTVQASFWVNEVFPPRKYITITDLRLTVQSSRCFKMLVREGLLTCYFTFLYGLGPRVYLVTLFMGHLCAFL